MAIRYVCVKRGGGEYNLFVDGESLVGTAGMQHIA